jgi:hypothetical protein
MRAMLSLCLSMLPGPLYALSILSARYELCTLQCACAAGGHWVAPCFVARHNFRARGGNCSVTELRGAK